MSVQLFGFPQTQTLRQAFGCQASPVSAVGGGRGKEDEGEAAVREASVLSLAGECWERCRVGSRGPPSLPAWKGHSWRVLMASRMGYSATDSPQVDFQVSAGGSLTQVGCMTRGEGAGTDSVC